MISMSQYLRCLKTYLWTVTVTQDYVDVDVVAVLAQAQRLSMPASQITIN